MTQRLKRRPRRGAFVVKLPTPTTNPPPAPREDAVAKMVRGTPLEGAEHNPLNETFWLSAAEFENRRDIMTLIDNWRRFTNPFSDAYCSITLPDGTTEPTFNFVTRMDEQAHAMLTRGHSVAEVARYCYMTNDEVRATAERCGITPTN